MVDSIGDLILIFGLNLSIGSPYYQGGRIWMNFRLSKCFIWDDILERHAFHSQNTLAESFCTGSDHPGLPRMIRPNSIFQHWVSPDDSALVRMIWPNSKIQYWASPDDPDLDICEHLVVPGRMIRLYTGWSGPGKFKCVFSLFCHYPGWSEVTPDDPGTTRKHTMVTFGGRSIYTPSPPSFISFSPRPTTPPKHSFLHFSPS